MSIDELDGLRHGVGKFAAVLHGFEAQVIQPEKAARKILGVGCNESLGKGAKRQAPCEIFFKVTLCLSFRPRETTGLGAFRLNLSAACAQYNTPGNLRARYLNQRRLTIIFR